MPKIKFDFSNIPTFYEFYKLLGEASLFNPKEDAVSKVGDNKEDTLTHSIVRTLISAAELQTQLKQRSPNGKALLVKGSPGQGKTTIIQKYYETLARESGLEFTTSTDDFFNKLLIKYRNDENFKTDVREILSSQYEDSDENTLETIRNLPLKTITGIQTAIRALIKMPVDETLQSFFDRYINDHFFIFNITSDRNERDFFSGQSNITGERSPIDKSSKFYSVSLNTIWTPYLISGINGALFVDEITRIANQMPEALNALALLITERQVASSKISDNIFIVSAGNFGKAEMDEYTKPIGDALLQRFDTFELSVTVDDFYDYIQKKYSIYKNKDASKIQIPKNFSKTKLGKQEIKPDIYLESGKCAYEIFEYLITTQPELFLEDKRINLADKSSPKYEKQRYTRTGIENIKKTEPNRVLDSDYLERRSEVNTDGETTQSASREAIKLESSNRLLEQSFQDIICVIYNHIESISAKNENNLDAYSKFKNEKEEAMKRAAGAGSPAWGSAIYDIFKYGNYNPITFRNIISRQYKKVNVEKLAEVFSAKKWTSHLKSDYQGQDLGAVDFEPFKDSYNIDSTSIDTIMDFCIIINSFRHYFGNSGSTISNANKRFIVLMDDIKGNTDESKKKYITFILDYCFKYRPSDGIFLLRDLTNKIPKTGADGDEFTEELQNVLRGRKNGISDAQIAQAEMASQGMKYEGELPKDEEDEKDVKI